MRALNTPDGIRNRNLGIRSPTLYPIELRGCIHTFMYRNKDLVPRTHFHLGLHVCVSCARPFFLSRLESPRGPVDGIPVDVRIVDRFGSRKGGGVVAHVPSGPPHSSTIIAAVVPRSTVPESVVRVARPGASVTPVRIGLARRPLGPCRSGRGRGWCLTRMTVTADGMSGGTVSIDQTVATHTP